MRTFCSVFLVVLLSSCGGAKPEPQTPVEEASDIESAVEERAPNQIGSLPAEGRLPKDLKPVSYRLGLSVVPEMDAFSGTVEIEATLSAPRNVIYMHGMGLSVIEASVTAEGSSQPARWTAQSDDDSFAKLAFQKAVTGKVTIRIAYSAPFSTQLDGLYKVVHGGESYVFTQMEPLAARRSFPCFDDPSFKTPFEINLTVLPGHKALTNTPQIGEATHNEKKTYRFAKSEAIPTYLVAIAVGPLDIVEANIPANDVRSSVLPFRGVAPKGRGAELAYAMKHTPAILKALEDYFGIPYPFAKLDIVAVPDFSAGAMENVGLITFRDTLLLVDEKKSNTGLLRFFAYITAHEIAHMWFGNLVTMEWWDDLWLNEAFASWIEHGAVETWNPKYEPKVELSRWVLRTMNQDSLDSARSIRQPIQSSHDIHNAFDGITYGKGAGVLSMFERWLGPEVFQTGVQNYLKAHSRSNATAEDLMSALSKASGKDVNTPFLTFLTQPGVPFVSAELMCGDEGASVKLSQQRYVPVGSTADVNKTWQIPVCIRQGVGRRVTEVCDVLTAKEGAIKLGKKCPDWIMPNADGAGYYRWSLAAKDLKSLKRKVSELTVSERLSYADSLGSAFSNAQTPADEVLSAMLPLIRDEHHAVAAAPLSTLRFVDAHLVSAETRSAWDKKLRKMFRFEVSKLGTKAKKNDSDETKLRRARVISFVADTLGEPKVRADLTSKAKSYLGFGKDDAINDKALDPDLRAVALSIAVQDSDAAFFDACIKHLHAATDGALRRNLLVAIGSATDDAMADKARALSLDKRLRVNEITRPLRVSLNLPSQREKTWQFVQKNIDALMKRLPTDFGGSLPGIMTSGCGDEDAKEVQAFFAERVKEFKGGPRNLSSAVEQLKLCGSRVSAQQEHVTKWLKK